MTLTYNQIWTHSSPTFRLLWSESLLPWFLSTEVSKPLRPLLLGNLGTQHSFLLSLGSIELDSSSDVGEDGWILEYAMTLVQPQPVQFLLINNPQIGSFTTFVLLTFERNAISYWAVGEIFSFNQWLDAVDGSYCTSEGGDDFTYDPQLPNPLPGGFKGHSCGTVKAPNVVSNSQSFSEYQFSEFYKQRQCNEFAKLGLMGVTVLYAAGNTGAAGAQTGYCLDDNGMSDLALTQYRSPYRLIGLLGSLNLNATHFNPGWPATCPWITVVGGTQVKANATTSSPSSPAEEVWNQDMTMGFFESGGGGFSNTFARPAYQEAAVDNYLKFLAKSDPGILKNFNTAGVIFLPSFIWLLTC